MITKTKYSANMIEKAGMLMKRKIMIAAVAAAVIFAVIAILSVFGADTGINLRNRNDLL